jgi:hypothetical protein
MNSLPIRDQTWLVPQISIHINSRNVWTFVFVRLFFAFLESRKRDHDEKNTLGKNINTSVTSTPPWRYKKGGYFHGHFKDGKRNGEARKITAITQWRDKMTPAADIQMSFFGIFFVLKGWKGGHIGVPSSKRTCQQVGLVLWEQNPQLNQETAQCRVPSCMPMAISTRAPRIFGGARANVLQIPDFSEAFQKGPNESQWAIDWTFALSCPKHNLILMFFFPHNMGSPEMVTLYAWPHSPWLSACEWKKTHGFLGQFLR